MAKLTREDLLANSVRVKHADTMAFARDDWGEHVVVTERTMDNERGRHRFFTAEWVTGEYSVDVYFFDEHGHLVTCYHPDYDGGDVVSEMVWSPIPQTADEFAKAFFGSH